MKKIIFLFIPLFILVACGSKKTADKTTEPTATAAEATKPAATGNDAALIQWLSGKMLISTEKDPKYDMWNNFKMNADGSCIDKDNASAKWTVENGKFVFQSVMNITKEMEKKDDTTLVFKGSIGENIYIVKPIN
ncbi:MAG: hypothetical protein WBC06_06210 [Chitinophagaceae bacterium]